MSDAENNGRDTKRDAEEDLTAKKARAAAEAREKARALKEAREKGDRANKAQASGASSSEEAAEAAQPAENSAGNTDAEEKPSADAKAKAAAAAKAKAAAAAKAKAAAAAKAKAAAAAKAKAQGGEQAGGDDAGDGQDEDAKAKAKAAAIAKAKAAAAAKRKQAGAGADGEEEKPKEPSKNQPLLDRYVRTIEECLGKDVIEEHYINDLAKEVPTLVVKRDEWERLVRLLRTEEQLAFDYMSSLHGTDFESHMEVYVHLTSMQHGHHIALRVKLDREQPKLASITPFWPGADWPERETYDLLGIEFEGHPDLRRILLTDDWVGHPLRKDYEQHDEEV